MSSLDNNLWRLSFIFSSKTSSTTNILSTHKKSSNYDNTNEKARMLNLVGTIINK